MKKIFYLSTVLILLFSCQQKAPEEVYFAVNGKFKNTKKGEIITLYQKKTDELITIDSAEFSAKGEFELVPRVGQHIVLLGNMTDYKKKIRQLKHFYVNVLNRQGWNKYKYLNLKFNNQIVCTKNS